MPLQIYDTFSNEKKLFEPIDPSNVRMYVCGPTVYDFPHVGNARPVIVFDLLFRLLRRIYGIDNVTYVRNITDVDDKIITAASENNEDIKSLTERTIKFFHDDADYIGALEPTFEPKATDYINDMIDIINSLIEKDYAYVSEDNVLFSASKFSKYGQLSGKNLEEMIAGSRVEVESFKRSSSDFVLWKPSKSSEPGWDSPWGKGRPGWHIECSAMSEKLLGKNFDIHGGGQDLIFPHHENEIAQSECANNEKFANFWLHNGFVNVEGNKMSKSEGNFVTVNQLKQKYQGEVIRLAMISTHYRQPLNWTENNLIECKKTLDKWYQLISENNFSFDNEKISSEVINALEDDLNTPKAISVLHQLYKDCKSNDRNTVETFLSSANFLGILMHTSSEWLSWGKEKLSIDEKQIELLISERKSARDNGNFEKADKIRNDLEHKGILLEDNEGKTTWRFK
tara:strand:- start:3197 stop:4558 length:1362 start_codon:yes stop_codon:yes gene_type:complete